MAQAESAGSAIAARAISEHGCADLDAG
jgi:hypothetical protein